MKKNKLHLGLILVLLVNIQGMAQNIRTSGLPESNLHTVKSKNLKLCKKHKPTGTLNSSAFLNYIVSDSVYVLNYIGTYEFYYFGQTMNSDYALSDTGYGPNSIIQNEQLIHSCSVVFDTILDATTYDAYPSNSVSNLIIDTLYIPIGHANVSGTVDTIEVEVDSVTNNDYPTNKAIWSTKILTDTGLSAQNVWSNLYTLVVPVNYALNISNKFCITMKYYGSKLDTMAFACGFPHFNQGSPYNCSQLGDTTYIGHTFKNKFRANSYTNGYQYYFSSLPDITLPTPSGTDSIFYQCVPSLSGYDTLDLPLLYQDIAIFAKVSFNSTMGGINGTTYIDENGDCLYDGGDFALPYVALNALDSLNNTIASTYTDGNGYYSLSPLNRGQRYKIEVDSTVGTDYIISCTSQKYDSAIAPTAGFNVALVCPKGFDLTGSLSACIDTPSFGQVYVYACIYNEGCMPTNSVMKLIIDTAIHINYKSLVADTLSIIIGDTLMWKYSDNGWGYDCVSFSGTVGNLPTNDSLHLEFIADPIVGDSNPSNNIINYWAPVFPHNCIGLPYDPNGKTVSPSGTVQPTQRLTYNIHFQNTGTAPAQNVVVIDTLSTNLDPSTLDVISSSSPMSIQISNGHIVTYTFSNINLVDTGTSKTASIGDVIYSIKPIANVTSGAIIQNKAGIYFDANASVITNTTTTFITTGPAGIEPIMQSINIACFPNPFTNSTSVVFNTDGKHYLELYDVTGRNIESIQCTGRQYELQRGNLASGIYFLKSFNAAGSYIAVNKLVVQ